MTISLKKKYVVLIVGPSGTGKSTLAAHLVSVARDAGYLTTWVNADYMRQSSLSNDLGFSASDRVTQASRAGALTRFALACSDSNFVVTDFICPTPETRRFFLDSLFGQRPTNSSARTDGSPAPSMPYQFNFDPLVETVRLQVVLLNPKVTDQFHTNFVEVSPIEICDDTRLPIYTRCGPVDLAYAASVFQAVTAD